MTDHPKTLNLSAAPAGQSLAGAPGSAKKYRWAAKNLERWAAEETDAEWRLIWRRAANIARAKSQLPNAADQTPPTKGHE